MERVLMKTGPRIQSSGMLKCHALAAFTPLMEDLTWRGFALRQLATAILVKRHDSLFFNVSLCDGRLIFPLGLAHLSRILVAK